MEDGNFVLNNLQLLKTEITEKYFHVKLWTFTETSNFHMNDNI